MQYLDIESDLYLIIAAFYKDYNINYKQLLKLPYMVFKGLFLALSKDTSLMTILSLRKAPNNQLDENLRKVKRAYSLDKDSNNVDYGDLSLFASFLVPNENKEKNNGNR